MNEIIACQYLIEEVKKTLDTLKATDPSTGAYHATLHSLECLYGLATEINGAVDLVEGRAVVKAVGDNVIPFPSEDQNTEVKAEPDPAAEVEEAPAPAKAKAKGKAKEKKEPEREVDKPSAVTPAKTYTKADLRKALYNARNEGVDIVSIYQQYGVNGINDLPEAAYAEIIELYGDI